MRSAIRGDIDTRAWRAARRAWLEENPCCVMCDREGRSVVATDVDHVIPHKGSLVLFWDRTNWQSLCHSHHSEKTAREDGGFGRRGTGGRGSKIVVTGPDRRAALAWIDARREPGDVVFDWQTICEAIGLSAGPVQIRQGGTPSIARAAIAMRDGLATWLARRRLMARSNLAGGTSFFFYVPLKSEAERVCRQVGGQIVEMAGLGVAG